MQLENLTLPPSKTLDERRAMHCGLLPRSEWLPIPWQREQDNWPHGGRVRKCGTLGMPGAVYATRDPDTGRVTPDVCPGFAARRDIVEQVAEAREDYEKGALKSMRPRLLASEAEGIRVLNRAVNEYQAQERAAYEERREMERIKRTAKAKNG